MHHLLGDLVVNPLLELFCLLKMIICKTGPGYEYEQATCSPNKWSDMTVPDGMYSKFDIDYSGGTNYYKANFDYDNVTWQRIGQEIMILPPYEFCPEVCTYILQMFIGKSRITL